MQPNCDELDQLAASCAAWSQPLPPPAGGAVATLSSEETTNAQTLAALCANLVGVLGIAQPPPPTPACPPNALTPPKSPPPPPPPSPVAPPWKKSRSDVDDAAGPESSQNPWSQEFWGREAVGSGAAFAACERTETLETLRPPRFGPVPGETPAEATARKDRNKATKKRGGKNLTYYDKQYYGGKKGDGKGSGGGSSGSGGSTAVGAGG